MSRYLLVAALVVGFSVPALAAKRYYNVRGAGNQCKIVNVAPYYTETKIRRGKRVYITRELAKQDMAIICKPY
jgi:hypothetical protein